MSSFTRYLSTQKNTITSPVFDGDALLEKIKLCQPESKPLHLTFVVDMLDLHPDIILVLQKCSHIFYYKIYIY